MTGETGETGGRLSHEHREARPHDDTHHLVAAFALLLLDRGARTPEDLSARLTQLQVVRGLIGPESLADLIEDLEREGLIARQGSADGTSVTYELVPAGRTVVDDWVTIMRDRRRLSRTFLTLYDRAADG